MADTWRVQAEGLGTMPIRLLRQCVTGLFQHTLQSHAQARCSEMAFSLLHTISNILKKKSVVGALMCKNFVT